jgi:hypothetical protein
LEGHAAFIYGMPFCPEMEAAHFSECSDMQEDSNFVIPFPLCYVVIAGVSIYCLIKLLQLSNGKRSFSNWGTCAIHSTTSVVWKMATMFMMVEGKDAHFNLDCKS